jgi:hypothetical protein
LESIGSSFDGTTIGEAVFHGTSKQVLPGYPERKTNEFVGNDFSGANLIDVGFRGGVDLAAQKLPRDGGYILINNVREMCELLSGMIVGLTDPTAKKRVEGLRGLLEFNYTNGQISHLLDVRGWGDLGDALRRLCT